MARKNENAVRSGNAPRRATTPGKRTFRDAWLDLVSAVACGPWETAAQAAATLTDSDGIPQRTEAWYARAIDRYDTITATSH